MTRKVEAAAKRAATRIKARKPAAKKTGAKGRPTDYRAEYAEQARKLCLLGGTNTDLGSFFHVDEATISRWKQKHSDFRNAIIDGLEKADAEVADRMYQRALGYSHPEVDIRVVAGKIVKTPLVKHYPPDTAAAVHWLNNRQRARWRTKVESEVSGPNGGPQQHEVDVKLSPDEAYLRMIGKA